MRTDVYTSKAWKTIRKAIWIKQHCICARCGRAVYVDGVSDYIPKEKRLKGIVHHKTYLTESNYTDDSIAYDENNLVGVCIECHNKIHNPARPLKEQYDFDEFGNLVEVKKITDNSL